MRALALTVLAAIAFALAAFDLHAPGGRARTRAVVIDRSASVVRRPGWSWTESVARATHDLASGDRWCLIDAAGGARVVAPLDDFRREVPPAPSSDAPEPSATDLRAAVDAARAALGSSEHGEIVLVTDRRATRGGRPAVEGGASIAFIEPPGRVAPNAAIVSVRAPAQAAPGERVRVVVDVATQGSIAPPDVDLRAGSAPSTRAAARPESAQRFVATFEVDMPPAAILEIDVSLVGSDAFPEDDRAHRTVVASGTARVAILGGEPALVASLRADRRIAIVSVADAARGDFASLAAIVLVDPAPDAWAAARPFLEDAQRAGVGLVLAGSKLWSEERLEGSALALASPLAPDRAGEDAQAILLLVDTSGSMAGAKLDAAKRAARALAERWGKSAGVRAAFFAEKLGSAFDPRSAAGRAALEQASARGATDAFGACAAAGEILRADTRASKRRIFLVSDGLHGGGGAALDSARACGAALAAARVECVAFAVGGDADLDLLAALTLDGRNGRTLRVERIDDLTSLAEEELARGLLAGGGEVTIDATPSSPVRLAALPPVVARARVKPRDGAVVLARVGDAPLVAIDRVARVAAIAVSPGAAEAPQWSAAAPLLATLVDGVRRRVGAREARIEGESLLVDDAEVGADASRRVRQGEEVCALWRTGEGQALRGRAGAIRPGWARLESSAGADLGPLWIDGPPFLEGSPFVAALDLPPIERLAPRASGFSLRPFLIVGAVVALVLAALLGRGGRR